MNKESLLPQIAAAMLLAVSMQATAQTPNPANPPSYDFAQLIEALTLRSDEGLESTEHPDGTVSIDLQDRYRNVTLARVVDGQPRSMCVSSLEQANAFFERDLRADALQESAVDADSANSYGISAMQLQRYLYMIDQAERAERRRLQAAEPAAPNAATLTIVNLDAAGEGFNDTSPRASEGGNIATTLGAQRLAVFNRAAQIWGGVLDSSVATRIEAQFDPLLPCTAGGGVLGSAGPNGIFRDFPGVPFSNTFYPSALANKLRGADLDSADNDISATFNSSVGVGSCLTGTRFYLGLDNATPANTINLLVVVLHEIGHGVGSLSFANQDGSFPGNFPDAWSRLMFDRTQNLSWFQMGNSQRQSSSTNTGNLVWSGANVRAGSGFLTAGRDAEGRTRLFAPSPFQGGSSVSHFDTALSPNVLMEPSINLGLPLTLDITRQQMRDIGWYRDTTTDGVPDTIINVLPSGGSVAPGSFQTVTWSNTGSFNDAVAVELSTDGGLTFPTVLAANAPNSTVNGSRSVTMPNLTTTQARIRVRAVDFAEPSGVSSANFSIATPNAAPSITAATGLTRTQGSAASTSQIATISDPETAATSLSFSTPTVPAQISVAGIAVAGGGAVSASLGASCTAVTGANAILMRVSDGNSSTDSSLSLSVLANTLPNLGYTGVSLNEQAGLTINPSVAASDNGITNPVVSLLSNGTYTGGFSLNSSTGVVQLSNASPVGNHVITIRITDSCGAIRDVNLNVTVLQVNTAPSFTAAASIIRQQGSPAGSAVQLGTVADGQSPSGNLTVSIINGGSVTGVTVNNLTNNAGVVSANISADCSAQSGTVRLQISDGSLSSTADVVIGINANTPPVLGSYLNTLMLPGASVSVNPSAAPTDNGTVDSLFISISPLSFTGGFNVAAPSAQISVTNANPPGVYQLSMRATDNCSAQSVQVLQLDVSTDFKDGFESAQ